MNELLDPWTLPNDPAKLGALTSTGGQYDQISQAVQIERISEITALSSGGDSEPDQRVPEQLKAWLLGEARSESMALYAVLDASRIANLETMLEASGHEYRCLFKGDAKEELGEVAPWLVKLDEDSDLTRRLFVRHPEGKITPFTLWGAQPGIFFRTKATLEEMWGHLRRFTRVPDETGAWFYFRFWEPEVAALYFPSLPTHMDKLQHWLRGPNDSPIHIIVFRSRMSDAVWVAPTEALPLGRPNTSFAIEPIERDVFRRVALGKFQRDLNDHLLEVLPAWEAGTETEKRLVQLRALIRDAKLAGLGIEQATVNYCEAALRMGRSPSADPITAQILQKDQHPVDRSKALLAHARSLSTT